MGWAWPMCARAATSERAELHGNMAPIAKQIVDSYGALTDIRGRRLSGGGLAALTLGFERGAVLIAAVGDDDTIRVSAVPEVEGDSLSQLFPWRDAIGRGVIWVWSLTNQQGYQDGSQLEFGKPAKHDQPGQLCVQIVIAASALRRQQITKSSA